ncbi:MAG: hypothetical protein EXQ95_03505 [Alphaproteobacteria bacterium]|nr:hypothetical protein [Alphaproteobacteria bacterium]
MKDLIAAFEQLSSGSLATFLFLLAAAGTISMAVIQIVKELIPVRRSYQRNWLTKWLAARVGVVAPPGAALAAVRSELIELATGGDDRAFFELPAEQVVAQMNAAAQIAMDYPRRHTALLSVLSAGVSADDLATFLAGPTGPEAQPRYTDARNRIGHRLQRNLDGLLIALGNDWRWWMQIIAIALTLLIVEIAVVLSTNWSLAAILWAVPVGIIGGYLAPITRDLVAALQNLRRK